MSPKDVHAADSNRHSSEPFGIRGKQDEYSYAQLSRMREFNTELDRLMREQYYSSKTPKEFLIEATKTATEVLRVQRASIWIYSEDHTEIRCECLYDKGYRPEAVGTTLGQKQFPNYFQAISQSRVVFAGDARTDPQTSEFTESYLMPLDIHSLLDAHIPSAMGVRGVLCCESVGDQRDWAVDEGSFAASLAELIGMSLERTEREHTHKQLAEALKAAEKAGEAKTAFLANMSHEIRTPMNGILGMLEIILLKEDDPKKRRQLEVANNSARSLLNVLDDVLDYSRLEAGGFSISSEPYSIKNILDDVVNLFRARAEEKCIDLISKVDASLPDVLVGDQVRVRQVLNNLLSNALKFTETGTVEVSLLKETKEDQTFVCLVVSDTGTGIPEHAQKTLFKRFTQADNSSTREYGGTGLGLAICKQLVELMNGSIGLSSIENKGSKFWVKLPVVTPDQDNSPSPTEKPSTEIMSRSQRLNILAAEDNVVNQTVLEAIIHSLGHEVTMVANGQEALNILETRHFDVVLMDIQMPIMDGLTATREIRSKPSPLCDITIISLTANTMEGDRERYLKAGINDYVAKPFRRIDISQALDRVTLPRLKDA